MTSRSRLFFAAVPIVAFLAACGADSTRQVSCDPTSSQTCFCADGREGLELCDDDGLLGPCLCGDDLPGGDVNIDVTDPPDAARSDTGLDVGVHDTGIGEDTACEELLLFIDEDGDGHGDNAAEPIRSCEYLLGYVLTATDCNDADRTIFPTAPELCDGVDNDCDGLVDEDVEAIPQWPDADDDGYGDPEGETRTECYLVEGYATNDDDCDDTTSAISPVVADLCDGIDNDCDGEVDENATFHTYFIDADGDGYGSARAVPVAFCDLPEGFVDNRRDCDDTDADVNPDGVEICNFADDDCDGVIDNGVDLMLLWPDEDADTYGDMFASPVYSCERLAGYARNNGDCDDDLFTVNPLGLERCNGRDDDCDGLEDNDAIDRRTFYPDADGDGFGVSTGPIQACTLPANHSTVGGDCDDRFATTNPDAPEVCDGVDNDCDHEIDNGVKNRCGTCGPEPSEICGNFIDDDCDGAIDEAADGCFCDGRTNQPCYTAAPGTLGIGICRGGTMDCACPGGARFCTNGEWGACEGQVLPAAEICDGIDNDCDGRVDEGLRNRCGECGADVAEICDGIDNDCDGSVDEFVRLTCGVCPGAAGVEVCGNGFDDDCDGYVDEDCRCDTPDVECYPGPPETLGVGACRAGTRLCYGTAETPSACTGAVVPSIEICDGIDNDCDGSVDESSTGCSICGASVEVCDGVDNDCDGFVDEGLLNGCGQCIASVIPEETGGLSMCNGIDDDCDGFVDEGLTNACGTCDEFCYTDDWDSDADFEAGGAGDGIGPDDGLRLNTSTFTFNDLWVANAVDDTVTRIDTNTGTVVATFGVGVNAGRNNDNPSRTAVDLDGNAWIANRAFGYQGSVTKILGGDCRSDCTIFTTNIGGINSVPRALAIDASNNAWVGSYTEERIYHIDGVDGHVIATYDIGMPIYGFAIDRVGIIWIASISQAHGVGAFDTRTNTFLGNWQVPGCGLPYGITVDSIGNVWFGTWTCGTLGRLDRAEFNAGRISFATYGTGLSNTRGVAVDSAGQIWLASSGNNRLARFNSSGTLITTSATCSNPIGVGIASDGNVWSMCYGSNVAQRWSATGAALADVPVGAGPYSYSDMTGFQLRAFTAPSGTWTQTYDCGFEGCGFEAIRWTATVPAGTTFSVRARSRAGAGGWSAWTAGYTTSPADTSSAVPEGRYLEVQVNMSTTADELTPVLTSLAVDWQRP